MLLLLKEPPVGGETSDAKIPQSVGRDTPQAGERKTRSASAKHNQDCYRSSASKNSGQYPQNGNGTRKNTGVLLRMLGAFCATLLFVLLVAFTVITVFGPTPRGATTLRYASFNWLQGAEVEAITLYPPISSAPAATSNGTKSPRFSILHRKPKVVKCTAFARSGAATAAMFITAVRMQLLPAAVVESDRSRRVSFVDRRLRQYQKRRRKSRPSGA